MDLEAERRLTSTTPEHLATQGAMAKSYKYYVGLLKSGSSSGISALFGSAADLLCATPEVIPPARLDITHLEPKDLEDLELRALYLRTSVYEWSKGLLEHHLTQCQRGRLGEQIQKMAKVDLPEGKLGAARKELTCSNLYLLALEQIDPSNVIQAWLKDFIWESLSGTDSLIAIPTYDEVLRTYDSAEPYKVCRKVASNVCLRLGFGELGDEAWTAINDTLIGAGELRCELLKAALTESRERIEAASLNLR